VAKVYRARRDLLLEGLARLDDLLETVPSVAGLHVSARFLDATTDDAAVVARAAARGVRVEALSAYHREQPVRPGLALGFAGVEPDAFPDALVRLEAAIRGGPR
jgi:GntR family transcriptional regulator/MocR family aminotransferase